MPTGFEKRFSSYDLVESYAKGRPTYPPALYQMIAPLTSQHERAWDVGTGNGQAAIGVAKHYDSVIATDISEAQLAYTKKGHNIAYANMSCTPTTEELERIVGPEGSVDLVTVAAALHWFDLEKFYPVVKHVLRKPGGVLAAWTYDPVSFQMSPELDIEFARWAKRGLPYKGVSTWSAYDLPFPFDPVPGMEAGKGTEGHPLEIVTKRNMTFDEYLHMNRSFSFVQKALEQGVDLLDEDQRKLFSEAWGPARVRTMTYVIYLLIGTVPEESD